MVRVRSVLRPDQERYARAREEGRRQTQDESAVVAARFDTRLLGVELEFRTGGLMMIPQRLVPGLEGASLRDLVTVSVSPAGDALSWRSLDIDVAVRGLVERAFGRRIFEPEVEPTEAVEAEAPPPLADAPATVVMSETAAARYIGMSAAWLKKSRTRTFRSVIDAPPFVRVGTKRVVYRRADLDAWLKGHLDRVSPR